MEVIASGLEWVESGSGSREGRDEAMARPPHLARVLQEFQHAELYPYDKEVMALHEGSNLMELWVSATEVGLQAVQAAGMGRRLPGAHSSAEGLGEQGAAAAVRQRHAGSCTGDQLDEGSTGGSPRQGVVAFRDSSFRSKAQFVPVTTKSWQGLAMMT